MAAKKRMRLIDMEGIGPVRFERSKKARHVNITVRPAGGVRVVVPMRLSWTKALEIASAKAGWIRGHQDRIRRAALKHEASYGRFKETDRNGAKKILINRLEELSQKNGLAYNRVFIRNQRTLWGSCSAKNNINLNMKLIRLPDELRDYVIIHELVHTRIKNHSRAFWSELDKHVGDAKKMQARLKEYGVFIGDVPTKDSKT